MTTRIRYPLKSDKPKQTGKVNRSSRGREWHFLWPHRDCHDARCRPVAIFALKINTHNKSCHGSIVAKQQLECAQYMPVMRTGGRHSCISALPRPGWTQFLKVCSLHRRLQQCLISASLPTILTQCALLFILRAYGFYGWTPKHCIPCAEN